MKTVSKLIAGISLLAALGVGGYAIYQAGIQHGSAVCRPHCHAKLALAGRREHVRLGHRIQVVHGAQPAAVEQLKQNIARSGRVRPKLRWKKVGSQKATP